MKRMKRVFASFLVLCLFVANIPTQTLHATELPEPVQSVVKSVTCHSLEVMEGTDGWLTSWNDPITNEYKGDYFRYGTAPMFDVEFTDGTVMTNQQYGVMYNGQYYSLVTSDTQSYDNPWTAGNKYTVKATLADVSTEFTVTVKESPIQSIVFDNMTFMEGTNGGLTSEYDQQTNELIGSYYHYDPRPTFTVTFKDGTTQYCQNGTLYYNEKGYSVNCVTDQSYSNQWGIGTHPVTATLMGVTSSFDVVITECPIQSIEIEDVEVIENTNGMYWSMPHPETFEPVSFYRYNTSFEKATVTFKDGTTKQIQGTYFIHNGEAYSVMCNDTQDYYNQWGIGEHEVTATVAGVTTTFNINIVESPYVTLEILNVEPVYENENCYYDGVKVRYNIPAFSYKVTSNDGTSFIGYYGVDGIWDNQELQVTSNQDEAAWTVGGNNTFTISYHGLTKEVSVDIIKSSPYEYYEENGEIYITGCREYASKIEIPSEIEGKPVVGILGLGNVLEKAEEIVIPDSVRTIAESAFDWNYSVKKITIGSGVTYLSVNTFADCNVLESIIVSEQNPNYCSVDGILYDKNVTTVVAYPLQKGNEYQVPATVTNIDIIYNEIYSEVELTFAEGSTAFVEEDGVIYNANKTKVISCDTAKSGEYVMPDTVTEIAEYAFSMCSELTDVVVSKNVTEITYYSFFNCGSLKSITLPTGLQKIDNYAFTYTSLSEVSIPDHVTEIGQESFYGAGIEKLTIGSSVKTIGDRAFVMNCMETLVIPDSVTYLGTDAFAGCMSLETIDIGSGISKIEAWTFEACPNLTNVTFRNKNVEIGDGAFCGCLLENVNWENVAGKIQNYAFSETGISKLVLPNTVTEIAYSSFGYSTKLSDIDIPESLIRVGNSAVNGTAWYGKQDDGLVYLEHVALGYKGEMPENAELKIKDGTTSIADMAFDTQRNMTKIELPEGLLRIGAYAFEACSGLTEIHIPASVKEIGDFAFENCTSLKAINVDANNQYFTSIDGVLFNKACTKLIFCPNRTTTSYEVPDSVTKIEAGAFRHSGVSSITIKNGDTQLEPFSVGYNVVSTDRNGYNKYLHTTIVCPEYSLAHAYAIDNLISYELMEPTESVKGFEVTATTSDKMYMGEEVTLEVTVKNISGKDIKALRWFNCLYYRESGNSETYPGISYGTLTDAQGNIIDDDNVTQISFAVDETKTFTYKFEVPETWSEKSDITFVISSRYRLTNYYGQEEFVAALDCPHKNVTVHEKEEATCTATGKEAYTFCNDCETVIEGANKEIPIAAHKLTEHKRVEPTHLAEGSIAYWECGVCKQYFSDEGKTIIANKQDVILEKTSNHDESGAWVSGEEAHWKVCGCGEKLLEAGHEYDNSCDTTCNVCQYERTIKHTWKESYSFNSNGHWIECSVCGEKQNGVENHNGGSATCQKKAECAVCNQPYGTVAPHDFTRKTIDAKYQKTAATCMSVATYYTNCTMCGRTGNVVFSGTEKDANNHTGVNHIEGAYAATCTGQGYTGNIHCECGVKVGTGNILDKLPHDVTEWTVESEPTVHSEGKKVGHCKDCKAEFIVLTAKLIAELKGEEKVNGNLSAEVETVGDTKLPGASVFVADNVTDEIETQQEEKQKVEAAVDKATKTVESVTEKHKVAAVLDLKIVVRETATNNEAIKETEHKPEGKVRVTVEIPKTVIENYENIILLHVKDDGSVEEVPFAYVDGNKAKFDTDGFSYYVFVGSEKPVVDNTTNTNTNNSAPITSAKTGDDNSALVWGAIMLLAIVGMRFMVVDKKRRTMK